MFAYEQARLSSTTWSLLNAGVNWIICRRGYVVTRVPSDTQTTLSVRFVDLAESEIRST